MREGREYRCDDCGLTSPVGTDCPSCGAVMRDENDNPPLRPIERRAIGASRALRAGLAAIGAGGILTLWGLPAFTASAALVTSGAIVMGASLLGPLVQRSRRRRQLAQRAAAVVAAARAIEPAEVLRRREVVRIRGTCVLLRAVPGPGGASVAAFTDRTERACGRFAVQMDKGVAVVDDDCVVVLNPSGSQGLGPQSGTVVAGATVEVYGPASHAPCADAALQDRLPGDRGTRLALSFDGTPDEPVVILV